MRCNWSRASPNQLLLRPQNKALGARIILTPWTRRKYTQRYVSGSSVEAAPSRTASATSAALASEPRAFVRRRVRVSPRGFSAKRVQQVAAKARRRRNCQTKPVGGYDVYPSMHYTRARAAQAGQWVHCKPRKSIPACV